MLWWIHFLFEFFFDVAYVCVYALAARKKKSNDDKKNVSHRHIWFWTLPREHFALKYALLLRLVCESLSACVYYMLTSAASNFDFLRSPRGFLSSFFVLRSSVTVCLQQICVTQFQWNVFKLLSIFSHCVFFCNRVCLRWYFFFKFHEISTKISIQPNVIFSFSLNKYHLLTAFSNKCARMSSDGKRLQ